jgi:hypothetical protein
MSVYVKSVEQDLKELHPRHVLIVHMEVIFNTEFIDMFMIYHRTKNHTPSSRLG